jgi:phosphoribosylaminoimidazole-succinocarboxamide synthase
MKEIIEEGLVESRRWKEVEDIAFQLFEFGQKIALERELILVDTKYEFGVDPEGKLMLVDEIHTPDSSRYWQAGSYEERFEKGLEPEYFDKEFLRLWFKEHSDPYKDEVMPQAPKEKVVELAYRYVQISEQLTGEKFKSDFTTPIKERIRRNLRSFGK